MGTLLEPSSRLRAERERLGFSQTAFAELVGASKKTQIRWEQGTSAPDAHALAAWARHGLDVIYVVTGLPAVAHARLAMISEATKLAARTGKSDAEQREVQEAAFANMVQSMIVLTPEEKAMLEAFRACSAEDQAFIRDLVGRASNGQTASPAKKRAATTKRRE